MKYMSADKIYTYLDWRQMIEVLRAGHSAERHVEERFYLGDSAFGLFARGVILAGRGAGFKVVSVFPANARATPPLPTEHSLFIVFDECTKSIKAILDGPAITYCKTAADSALAASILSRHDSDVLLVLGSGPIALSLAQAFLHIRPAIGRILLWNRTRSKLQSLAVALQSSNVDVKIVENLNAAVAEADIITSATASDVALIKGRYVKPGAHVDLVGSFRPDMCEADVALLKRARIFVDDRSSALCSGDLLNAIAQGCISEASIEGDLYSLCQAASICRDAHDITVYKNGGGAHLDLMIGQYMINEAYADN